MTPDRIFARIARRYDRLNHVLSLGQEQHWRRRGVEHLPFGRVLDLGSGTGSVSEVMGPREVVALDPVIDMLSLSAIPHRVVGRGEALPFADESFDGVFSAYVFRNLTSIPSTLDEVLRVLRPGGVMVVVDLGRPRNRWAALVHRMGSAMALTAAGLAIGAVKEYRYLHRSLDKLAPPELLYRHEGLAVEVIWRMGPLGFVHGAVMRKGEGPWSPGFAAAPGATT